jgi:hypothetical protein
VEGPLATRGSWEGAGREPGLPANSKPGCRCGGHARRVSAQRAAHQLLLEIEALWSTGITSHQGLAAALTDCGGVYAGRGSHPTVSRVRPATKAPFSISIPAIDPRLARAGE